ncbi:helix-turn-helix domain-containing protein [Bacteroides sp. Marseille-P3684]|uniref:helix-turn-helix domain-containing protein n=1 Tax=Bacteroides sp. Marseille-P3684 TaxID=2086579 RepID=UPI000D0ADD36|nr:helix-turn-helix domain-containing protein [Bacteroides sp. Marseille-P3684]
MSSNLKIKRICAWCGKEFIAQKTTTACCSKQCANALYKKRKRDEAIKTNNQIVEKKIEEKPIERIKDKPFLTITETAIYLGVTRPTVYGYIKRGELNAIRLGFKYLLKKEDIDKLFHTPIEFHTPTKEKSPITDFYTTAEVKEKYHVNESWIFVIAKKHNIPRTFNRGKTYWSKKHIDAYFAKKAPNPDITEWYSTQDMQDKFGMTMSAIYNFASKNAIPKKKEGIMVYYSKKHVDIAKGISQPEETLYYTVAEAMEKFHLTRDQLYHYVKWHHIAKVKKGKYTFINRAELDKLLAPPKIE